jgi:hypothetical protein
MLMDGNAGVSLAQNLKKAPFILLQFINMMMRKNKLS